MATHLEACRAVFKERVLPYFPHTKERFARHFDASYELLRALPSYDVFDLQTIKFDLETTMALLGIKTPSVPAKYPAESIPDHISGIEFDLEVAMTVLGIKPLTNPATSILIHLSSEHIELAKKANLRVDYVEVGEPQNRGVQTMIYDPVLLAEVMNNANALRHSWSSSISPHTLPIIFAKDPDRVFNNVILGYPEPSGFTKYGEVSKPIFAVTNTGFISPGVPYGTSYPRFRVTAETIMKTMEAWASAAALVEEIRGTSPAVYTVAVLADTTNGHKEIVAKLTIMRSEEVGNWQVVR